MGPVRAYVYHLPRSEARVVLKTAVAKAISATAWLLGLDTKTGKMANAVKDATPRQGGGSWWIILVVLLIVGGLFWAFGRSGDEADPVPVGAPARTAAPDQIENTVRADGHSQRVEADTVPERPSRVREADPNELEDPDTEPLSPRGGNAPTQ